MSRLTQVAALVLCCTFAPLAGCNAALGIDEAHSRDDGLTAPTSLAVPVAGCDTPHTTCGTCVANSNAFPTCLGDHNCRKALDAYRECLGSKCDAPSCFDTFSASVGHDVAEVVQAECPACAGNSPLASMCDLYCACMQQSLPPVTPGAAQDGKTCETVNDQLGWTAGDPASCKKACTALAATDLASVNCRWGHCELAANGESRTHCQHAVDSSVCPTMSVASPDCKDRRGTGWACDTNDDCCTKHCSGHICQQ